jgi:hypothetical protein
MTQEKAKKLLVGWEKARKNKFKVPIATMVTVNPLVLKEIRETRLTKPRSIV